MRAASSIRVFPALALLALAGGCSSETIGPVTSGKGTMTVVPSSVTIGQGEAVQLTAKLVDEFGDPLEAAVFWSSSNPSVATVSGGGTVTGRREGRAAIMATANGRSHGAAVHVVEGQPGGKPRPQL
jgi:uncharacterized protein YjdB